MSAPVNSEIIRYDGHKVAVETRPRVGIEACRGRRWRWCGEKGWWVHLYLLHGWHMKKFVRTLSEAGIFLSHDIDMLPWLTREQQSADEGELSSEEYSGIMVSSAPFQA